jgi:hypothetical protein
MTSLLFVMTVLTVGVRLGMLLVVIDREGAKAAKSCAPGMLRIPVALATGDTEMANDSLPNRTLSLLASGEKGATLPSSFWTSRASRLRGSTWIAR